MDNETPKWFQDFLDTRFKNLENSIKEISNDLNDTLSYLNQKRVQQKDLNKKKPIINILRPKKFAQLEKSGKDLYEILEVSRDSNVKEIKKVYRKWCKVTHPDHNKSETAHEDFISLQKIYKKIITLDYSDHLK